MGEGPELLDEPQMAQIRAGTEAVVGWGIAGRFGAGAARTCRAVASPLAAARVGLGVNGTAW